MSSKSNELDYLLSHKKLADRLILFLLGRKNEIEIKNEKVRFNIQKDK